MPGTFMRALVAAALGDKYKVGDPVGHGASGHVFMGRQRSLGRDVAIKVLSDTRAGAPAGFLAEAQLLATLDHGHIVRVYDMIEAEGVYLIILELLPGGTLADRRAELSPEAACAVGLGVAEALEHAHSHGVLHRDIKPDNILFDAKGVVKVTDFGIAKILGGMTVNVTAGVGTPKYMPREQLDPLRYGQMGPGTDLYALGTVLYELLAGQSPFGDWAQPWSYFHHAEHTVPSAPPGVPPRLADVILRALAKDLADRQPTAHAFALDLATAARQAYGPRWLSRAGMALHLSEDVRYAADRTEPVTGPDRPEPAPPTAEPAASAGPNPATAMPGPGAPQAGAAGEDPRFAVTVMPDAALPADTADHGVPTPAPARSGASDAAAPSPPPYLRTYCAPIRVKHPTLAVAFLTGGAAVATAGHDKVLRLWTVPGFGRFPEQVGEVETGHARRIRAIAFTPDRGGLLATGGEDRTVRLWRLTDPARPAPLGAPLEHAGRVFAVGFCTDARRLVTVGGARLHWWDLTDPDAPVQLSAGFRPAEEVTTLAVSGDGTLIAYGMRHGAIGLASPNGVDIPGPLGSDLAAHDQGGVQALAFSPDGTLLASASVDGSVTLWDVRDPVTPRQQCPPLAGHEGAVNTLAFNQEGTFLASGGNDCAVRLWDLTAPGVPVPWLPARGHLGPVTQVAFSPENGAVLASASTDPRVRFWFRRGVPRVPRPAPATARPAAPPEPAPITEGAPSTERPVLRPDGPPPGPSPRDNGFAPTCPPGAGASPMTEAGPTEAGPTEAGPIVRLLTALPRHVKPVRALAFSSDGEILASAGHDRVVHLWDVRTGAPRGEPLTGHTLPIRALAFAPRGHLLATGGDDRIVRLWQLAGKQGPRLASEIAEGAGNTTGVRSLAFGATGRRLAIGRANQVGWWDVERADTPAPLASLHGTAVTAVAATRDGRMLAYATRNGSVALFGAADLRTVIPLAPAFGAGRKVVAALAFSPDATVLATAGGSGSIRLWDLTDPTSPQPRCGPLTGPEGPVHTLAFSPDGLMLASGGDKLLRLWDLTDLASPRPLPPADTAHGYVFQVAFSPDGSLLATAGNDGVVRLWTVDRPALRVPPMAAPRPPESPTAALPEHQPPAGAGIPARPDTAPPTVLPPTVLPPSVAPSTTPTVAWESAPVLAPPGPTAAEPGPHTATHEPADAAPGPGTAAARGAPKTTAGDFGHDGAVLAAAFSSDGRLLASGGADRQVRLWDVATPWHPSSCGEPLSGHADRVEAVAFSPVGGVLASAGSDGPVFLWDVSARQPQSLCAPLYGHTGRVWTLAFSPDGRLLASGGEDGTVRLWAVDPARSPRAEGPPIDCLAGVRAIAFTPDRWLLTAADLPGGTTPDGPAISLWDLTTRRAVAHEAAPTGSDRPVWSVAFSSDCRLVATGAGRVWKKTRRSEVRLFSLDPGPARSGALPPLRPRLVGEASPSNPRGVTALAFSPDGRRLAGGCADTAVRVWNVTNPSSVRSDPAPLRGHTGWVKAVAFSPDGRTLASGGDDGTLRLWNLPVL